MDWSSFFGKAKTWLIWGGGPAFAVVIIIFVMFGAGFMASCDESYDIAMKEINSCKAVTERLGTPIEQKFWGRATGSSETRGGTWGNSQWSIPVAGPKGSGRYQYAAELHGGSWQVLRASLEVGNEAISVVPCGGEWLAKSIEEGKNSKPLTQAFGQVGTVEEASGATSVKTGDSCEANITPNKEFPASSPFNCRVVVKCGPKVIYGWEGSGYTNCETDKGMPTRANDPWGTAKDTDPIVEVDLPRSRITVRDDNPDSTYSINIAFPTQEKQPVADP